MTAFVRRQLSSMIYTVISSDFNHATVSVDVRISDVGKSLFLNLESTFHRSRFMLYYWWMNDEWMNGFNFQHFFIASSFFSPHEKKLFSSSSGNRHMFEPKFPVKVSILRIYNLHIPSTHHTYHFHRSVGKTKSEEESEKGKKKFLLPHFCVTLYK